MRLICPACGCYGPLDTFCSDEDAKQAGVILDALPADLGRRVRTYLGYFRNPKAARVMAPSRFRRLAEELRDLVSSQDIQWDGRRILPNRPEYWARSLDDLAAREAAGKIRRPLENHNYLRAMAYGLADAGAETALREREGTLMSGRRPEDETATRRDCEEPRKVDPLAAMQRAKALRDAAKAKEGEP